MELSSDVIYQLAYAGTQFVLLAATVFIGLFFYNRYQKKQRQKEKEKDKSL